MSAAEVIRKLEEAGGAAVVDGEHLRVRIPKHAAWLRGEIRQRREEIITLLQGEVLVPVACTCSRWSFPHIHSEPDRRAAAREWNRVCSLTTRIQ